jgi:hypothetical protein
MRWKALVDAAVDLVRSTRTGGGARPPRRDDHPRAATPRQDDDAVVFEYAPELDGEPDPGEVVWTWVAYEDDPRQGKDRPVVIVGRRGRSLVGVALTSKRHGDEQRVPVGTGGWDAERRPSYAKVDRLLDVRPAAVRREGSILERQRFDEVVAAVRSLHGTGGR